MTSIQLSISDILSSVSGDSTIYTGYCGDDGQPRVHWPSFYFLKSDFQSLVASEKFPFDFQGCLTYKAPATCTAAAERRETLAAVARCIKNYKKNAQTRTFSKALARKLLGNKSESLRSGADTSTSNTDICWLSWKTIRAIFKSGKEENDKIVLQNNLPLQVLMDQLDEVSSLNYTHVIWREEQRREAREKFEQTLVETN